MDDQAAVFNHVGLCVSDRKRARRFYEEVFGFVFWWEIEPPDDGTDKLLQLSAPIGLHGTYLIRDGLVLELLDYAAREAAAGGNRPMDQLGLTHLSFSVTSLDGALKRVAGLGGTVLDDTVSQHSAMIRDPDGQLIELLTTSWLDYLPPRPQ